jgi:hypothetical protein
LRVIGEGGLFPSDNARDFKLIEGAMKHTVGVGREFDVSNVVVLQLEIELVEARTKCFVTLAVTAAALVFLFGAALLGLIEGHFAKLQEVCPVVLASSAVTGIFGYYFGSKGPKVVREQTVG